MSADKLKTLANNLNEINRDLNQVNDIGADAEKQPKESEDITFIECEIDQDQLASSQISHSLTSTPGNLRYIL